MNPRVRFVGVFLAGCLFFGCGRVQNDPGTGAKECVQSFFQAIINEDWRTAYGDIAPGSPKAATLEQFAPLARGYRINLGFEPDELHIQSCQEHGQEAIAHLILTGRNVDQARRYKDAIKLRRSDDGWRIVLSRTFGQRKK